MHTWVTIFLAYPILFPLRGESFQPVLCIVRKCVNWGTFQLEIKYPEISIWSKPPLQHGGCYLTEHQDVVELVIILDKLIDEEVEISPGFDEEQGRY